ncbi:DUF4346 domain-containing protein [Prochlorococcus sp. MIT 1223]|uniref:DUF4346 domain-containing protein n=1 Tax=Prochlorococcus sp. MIT 1223 TaxID=3096217 RepID=UPI002A74CBEB|nr:DUF4346 domain-containing protein [Prochlorococcus sp. MIT 1223]|tara:strand:- start:207 stop:608 length:402 start_codon:yes stop_codon:yes gene_type:complete
MNYQIIETQIKKKIKELDEKLSKRLIELDPKGYFIVKIDQSEHEILVEHYSNDIDSLGRAINPDTGKPIGCKDDLQRVPTTTYRGSSAKEVGIKITEGSNEYPISRLDHALYLGRELQRAEECLRHNKDYKQD